MASIGIADKTTLDAVKTTVDDIASAGNTLLANTTSINNKADTIIDKIDNLDVGGGGGGGGSTFDLSKVEVFAFNSAVDDKKIIKGGVNVTIHKIYC